MSKPVREWPAAALGHGPERLHGVRVCRAPDVLADRMLDPLVPESRLAAISRCVIVADRRADPGTRPDETLKGRDPSPEPRQLSPVIRAHKDSLADRTVSYEGLMLRLIEVS